MAVVRCWLPACVSARAGLLLLVIAGLFLSAGCPARPPSLPEVLEITDVTTGWFDAGIVEGKNKLVPTISFRLRNQWDQPVRSIQVNAVFRRVGELQEWSSSLVFAIDRDGLPSNEATAPIVIRASLGYTGEQPRAEMLQHSEFVDAEVELFGRQAGAQWERLETYQIERQLLTR
jgi:hypothetical protein